MRSSSSADAFSRIAKTARIAEIFTLIGIIMAVGVLIFIGVLLILDISVLDHLIIQEHQTENMPITLSTASRVATYMLFAIPMLIGVYIFNQARLLFVEYRNKRVFTFGAARRLQHIGWGLVLLAPIDILCMTLTKIALTLGNEVGQRHISFGFSESDMYAIILGLLLVVLGRILHEAAIISQENKAFI